MRRAVAAEFLSALLLTAAVVGARRAACGVRPLRTIAIVDDTPQGQYLYPEFLLFRKLFQAHGFLMAARLHQGQTTNFRTAGGGFAQVFLRD